jgi:uncharacterized membrane protein YfcA
VIDDYSTIILLIICGFGSGVFVSLSSGTAIAIMIPCLTILIGYSIHLAIGTSLVVDCIIGAVAGIIFLKSGNVDMRSGFLLAITGVFGALIGSRFTAGASTSGLGAFIGIFLIITGVNFIIKGIQRNIDYIEDKISLKIFKENKTPFLIIFGLIIGLISGFSGMGGSRMVALVLIFILGYKIHTAIGTSLIMMVFIAGAGAIGHAINGEVLLLAALFTAPAAGLGALSGSLVANRIDEDKLGRIVGVIILILGMLIMYNTFF